MNTKDNLVSSPELAELFGVTDRYIRMLAKDEIVKKSGTRGKYLLAESIKGFINDEAEARVFPATSSII